MGEEDDEGPEVDAPMVWPRFGWSGWSKNPQQSKNPQWKRVWTENEPNK